MQSKNVKKVGFYLPQCGQRGFSLKWEASVEEELSFVLCSLDFLTGFTSTTGGGGGSSTTTGASGAAGVFLKLCLNSTL